MTKGRSDPWYPHGFNYKVTDERGYEVKVEVVEDGDFNRLKFLVSDPFYHGRHLTLVISGK
jgi:hypothetical protein